MNMYQPYQYNGYPPQMPPMIKQEPMDYPPPYPMEYMDMSQYQPLPPVPPPMEEAQPKVKKRKTKKEPADPFKEKKPRKKIDRFKGMPEEEVAKRTLPDHLKEGLDIVIIGINPGLMAAFKGHHYAGPGNHFWKCLYLSGMTAEPLTAMDDFKLLDMGIGFTNMVERTTRGSADLTRKEIKEGAAIMVEKIRKYRPLIACFNGKGIYEIFSGKKDFEVGRQPETIPGTDTAIYVMPSSSARCSQFPRAQDKVTFYTTLRDLRDKLKAEQAAQDPSAIPNALPSGSSEQTATTAVPAESRVPAAAATAADKKPAEKVEQKPVTVKQEKNDMSYNTCQSNNVPCTSSSSVGGVVIKSEPVESKDYITLQPMKPMENAAYLPGSMASYSGGAAPAGPGPEGFTIKQEPMDGPGSRGGDPYGCPSNSYMPRIKQEMVSPGGGGSSGGGYAPRRPGSGPNAPQQWPTVDLGNFIDDIPPIASNAAVPVSEEEYATSQDQYTAVSSSKSTF